MKYINIKVPKEVADQIDKVLARGGYASRAEYVKTLVRAKAMTPPDVNTEIYRLKRRLQLVEAMSYQLLRLLERLHIVLEKNEDFEAQYRRSFPTGENFRCYLHNKLVERGLGTMSYLVTGMVGTEPTEAEAAEAERRQSESDVEEWEEIQDIVRKTQQKTKKRAQPESMRHDEDEEEEE